MIRVILHDFKCQNFLILNLLMLLIVHIITIGLHMVFINEYKSLFVIINVRIAIKTA